MATPAAGRRPIVSGAALLLLIASVVGLEWWTVDRALATPHAEPGRAAPPPLLASTLFYLALTGAALALAMVLHTIRPTDRILRRVPAGTFSGRTLGAAAAYLAVCLASARVADWLGTALAVPRRGFPGLDDARPGLLVRDLAASLQAGVVEEVLLFAAPLTIIAVVTRGRLALAGLPVVIALRYGAHLYYGPVAAALFVAPWMIGAWLLYRRVGSIRPLIVGHVGYDVLIFASARLDRGWPEVLLITIALIGICCCVVTALGPQRRQATDAAAGGSRPW